MIRCDYSRTLRYRTQCGICVCRQASRWGRCPRTCDSSARDVSRPLKVEDLHASTGLLFAARKKLYVGAVFITPAMRIFESIPTPTGRDEYCPSHPEGGRPCN